MIEKNPTLSVSKIFTHWKIDTCEKAARKAKTFKDIEGSKSLLPVILPSTG